MTALLANPSSKEKYGNSDTSVSDTTMNLTFGFRIRASILGIIHPASCSERLWYLSSSPPKGTGGQTVKAICPSSQSLLDCDPVG